MTATAATLALAPSTAQAVVLPNNVKSVGYMPSWAGNVNSIQYGELTHINYAFVLPNDDGSLRPVENPQAQSNGTLRNPQASKCLDVTDNSSADGARPQIWDCFGGANQIWQLPA